MEYVKHPCTECPWRMDVEPGRFPPARFRMLAACAKDMAHTLFACHKSPTGAEFACAGFLLRQGAHNLAVRLAQRDAKFDVSSDYPLYANYRAMAIANGVRPDDPALRKLRDDGQTE